MNVVDDFVWESEVRDSELDFQGIVNNANYFVYMMHARHKHIKSLGIDVVKMHESGFDLILVHATIDFKASLRSGDEFLVTSRFGLISKVRISCWQQVIRKIDNRVMAEGKSIFTCVKLATKRPAMPNSLITIFCPKPSVQD